MEVAVRRIHRGFKLVGLNQNSKFTLKSRKLVIFSVGLSLMSCLTMVYIHVCCCAMQLSSGAECLQVFNVSSEINLFPQQHIEKFGAVLIRQLS